MAETLIGYIYLIAASMFIIGLRRLSSPKTAPSGNQLAALAMFIAVIVTVLDKKIIDYRWILASLAIGGGIGAMLAIKIKMTNMPQLVALFNGFGGAASAFVAGSEICRYVAGDSIIPVDRLLTFKISVVLSVLIGSLTFTGSFIAFAKLQELIKGRPIVFPFQKSLNAVLGLVLIFITVLSVLQPDNLFLFMGVAALASLLGVLLVIPIGGADMPVIISLLNAYSGIAATATGFVLGNYLLIISGSLVGASGIILTKIMCKAMNRSLPNVLFGAVGQIQAVVEGDEAAERRKNVKGYSAEDAAVIFMNASSIIIVPGFGMAVAQAQHAVKELSDLLEKNDISVKFAIHPVAGRMPGHMNVLLAEANVPYEQLVEMETINPEFPQTDVALVIGANDVTNPAARTQTDSPLYGMPIIDVDKAKTVMFCKRSMSPGFAGIDNELFYLPQTMMLFGDGKNMVMALIAALREIGLSG